MIMSRRIRRPRCVRISCRVLLERARRGTLEVGIRTTMLRGHQLRHADFLGRLAVALEFFHCGVDEHLERVAVLLHPRCSFAHDEEDGRAGPDVVAHLHGPHLVCVRPKGVQQRDAGHEDRLDGEEGMPVLKRLVKPLVGLADIASCTKADVVVGVREGQGGQEWLYEETKSTVVVQHGIVQIRPAETLQGRSLPLFQLDEETVHLRAERV